MTDAHSNVFHKALAYQTPDGKTALLTGGGTRAIVKLWTKEDGAFKSQILWEKDFGGRFSRIRDIEVGDIDGNGTNVIVVATHDQGVVAVIRPKDGGYAVTELDSEEDTFVHERVRTVNQGDDQSERRVPGEGSREVPEQECIRGVQEQVSHPKRRCVEADRVLEELEVHEKDRNEVIGRSGTPDAVPALRPPQMVPIIAQELRLGEDAREGRQHEQRDERRTPHGPGDSRRGEERFAGCREYCF